MPTASAGGIVAFTGRSNADYAFQLWEVVGGEIKNDRSREAVPPAARRCGICAGPGDARRCGRAQSRGARLQTSRPDQMESAKRRRRAKRGARGRPVEAWALHRAQQVAL